MRPKRAFIDDTRAIAPRMLGCFASFVGFILLLGLADYLGTAIPKRVLMIASVLAGAGLVRLYGTIARRRWGVAIPDVVRVLERDLRSFRSMEAGDYRLSFTADTSFGDRALHECLYALKWLGHFLIFVGLGTMLLGIMRALGIVDTVAKLG